MTSSDAITSAHAATSAGATARAQAPTARRDFSLLWAGQSTSLLGDEVMLIALPLLAVTTLGVSAAEAALLPFALFGPFLIVGLPAGAIVDRLPRRATMMVSDGAQAVVFATIAVLALLDVLSWPLLLLLVGVAGCATVFFQVSVASYLPSLFARPSDLHRGNARLYLSESVARVVGPMLAGPLIALAGATAAIGANAGTFGASVLALLGIRHREGPPAPPPRTRGWLRRDIRDGLRFVVGHRLLEPVILCGAVYVLFLSMIEASLVLYCRDVLGLAVATIGLVVGSAAAGFPIGNLVSGRLIGVLGIPRTLVAAAFVSVAGILVMPVAGSAGSVAGLIAGSVLHSVGEGAFGPTALTLRQTATPSGLLARVNSVQRFLIWGMIPLGSLLAAAAIAGAGLSAALWIGAVGTALCLPILIRRGIRAGLRTVPSAGGRT